MATVQFKRMNKKDMEKILVGYGDLPLADGTANGALTAPVATAGMVNSSTTYGIAPFQLGAYSMDLNSTVRNAQIKEFLQAGDTVQDVESIALVQGGPVAPAIHTANWYEAEDATYVHSGILRAGQIRSVCTRTCVLPCYSAELFSGFQPPLDLTDYKGYIEIASSRNDLAYGDNDEVVESTYFTPDYTALATTITNPLDHLLSQFVFDWNRRSRLSSITNGSFTGGNRNFVVLGINTAGGAGPTLGSLTANTIVPILECVTNGTGTSVVTNLIVDMTLVNTINKWITADAAVANYTIELVNPETAGTGATPGIDSFIVLGLDEVLSLAFDDMQEIKTTVRATLGDAFRVAPLYSKSILSYPHEGIGKGRDWGIEYDNRHRLQVHTLQKHPHGEYFIEGYDYVNRTGWFTSTIIDYFDFEETITIRERSPKQVTILLTCEVTNPTADAATGYAMATVDTATVADLNAVLGEWLLSERVLSNHEVLNDATVGGPYFV